jgi:hypothetical protein
MLNPIKAFDDVAFFLAFHIGPVSYSEEESFSGSG